jgi:hypothetical protein
VGYSSGGQGSGVRDQGSAKDRASGQCPFDDCAAGEIDLAEVGHAVIMRCRIVMICKTGWDSVDAFGEARGGFRNGSSSSRTNEEISLRRRECNIGRARQGMDAGSIKRNETERCRFRNSLQSRRYFHPGLCGACRDKSYRSKGTGSPTSLSEK